MAFDAGAIEATLTLNRNPFTAGLEAAKTQAQRFARQKFEVSITAKLDRTSLKTVKEQIAAAVARLEVKVSLDRTSLKAVQEQISKSVGRLQVKVSLDRETLARVKEQIANSAGRINVKAFLDRESLLRLRERLLNLNARVSVRPVLDRDGLLLLRARLESLNATINVRARLDRSALSGMASFNQQIGEGSESMGRFQRIAVAVIALLPIMASGFNAAVGAAGALASTLLIVGLGAGAFALVAVPAFKQVKDAVSAGQAEINKLPPGLREAGNAMKELTTEFDKLTKANQFMVGIAMSTWFNAGSAALRTLNPLVQASAMAFADAGIQAIKFFNSPWWQQFVDFLSKAIGPATDMLFRSIFALIKIVGNLTEAFWNLGGSQIMEMITSGLEKFAVYTERIGQNKTFQAFMDSAVRSLPVVGALIGSLLEFIIKLAIGLEPLGTLIVRVLDGIFAALNSLPVPVIQGIALAIGAVWAAVALGATGPVGLAIGVMAGLAAIFVHLAETNDSLKTSLESTVDSIKAKWQPIWDTIVNNFNDKILPAWNELVRITRDELIPKLQKFGEVIEKEVWPKIQPLVDTITGQLIPAFLGFLGALERIIGFLVDVFGPTVASEMGDTLTVFDGTFKAISGLLNIFTGVFTADWTTFTRGITQLTEGFWTIIAGMFGTNLDGLRAKIQEWDAWIDNTWRTFWNGITGFFRGIWDTLRNIWNAGLALMQGDVSRAVDQIGQAWRRVANFFREPINWVIRTVIGPPGGLAGAWNTVMGWIGQPQLTVSAPPQIPAFARGGVLPGYAPRQDTLLAAVSPGEAIMVPEWTKAVGGPGAVAKMNAAAISGMYQEGNPRTYSLGGTIPHFAYGGVAPHVAAAGDEITRVFGRMPGGIGGVGARANASDHPSGFALDFMTLGNRGLGNRISDYLFSNWGRLALKYIIFLQRIASSPGAWRGMADRGSPTANHMDHVHASFLGGPGGGGAPIPMVSWWSIIGGKVSSLLKGLFGGSIPGVGGAIGDAMSRIPGALVDKTLEALQKKLEGLMTLAGSAINTTAEGLNQNPLSGFGTTDRGGWLPPGDSIVRNATGKMEPLTNLDVYERMKPAGLSVDDVLRIIESRGGGPGAGGDTYNVMLPPRATVRELADQIDFKRRVVSKGRYSR